MTELSMEKRCKKERKEKTVISVVLQYTACPRRRKERLKENKRGEIEEIDSFSYRALCGGEGERRKGKLTRIVTSVSHKKDKKRG